MQADALRPGITFLSWDTETGARASQSLLRPNEAIEIWFRKAGEWQAGSSVPHTVEAGATTRYTFEGGKTIWAVEQGGEAGLRMSVSVNADVDALQLRVPFDPTVTPPAILPSAWNEDGSVTLPAILNAADFGAMRLDVSDPARVTGWMRSNHTKKSADLVIELRKLEPGRPIELTLRPFYAEKPAAIIDDAMWADARRGWLNAFQPVGLQEETRDPKIFPAGGLGNDVTTAAVSCSLWFYAGQSFWTPQVAPGVSVAALLRRTLDHMLDRRILSSGRVVTWAGYDPPNDGVAFPETAPHPSNSVNYLDSVPSTLISSWFYVESTGDLDWLRRRIDVLERVGGYLVSLDADNDGLIESYRTGNRGGLVDPDRGDSWWDAVNAGHKNAYLNLLAYRALRSLSDLEDKVGRTARRDYFAGKAERLRKAFHPTFFNPKTGWYGWWRSKDGELHDYASPFINGMAIEYGLVDLDAGREVLSKLRAKMREVGFERFDLGLPATLVPIPRDSYLIMQSAVLGASAQADGSDGFQHYMNGGTNACFTLPFLAALYVVGEDKEADTILRAMLTRQVRGGFQNGKRQAVHAGVEWTKWDGTMSGGDGYLADNYQFLQAILLREPTLRDRFYRPLRR